MSNVKTEVGTQDIILGLIWGGAPHIRIGLDTAHYSESGGDTAHNTIYYSESGGDTAHEKVFRCSHRGGDTAPNQSGLHKCCWVGGRLGDLFEQ